MEEEAAFRLLRMGVQRCESLGMGHLLRWVVGARVVETSPLYVWVADRDSRPPRPRRSVLPRANWSGLKVEQQRSEEPIQA